MSRDVRDVLRELAATDRRGAVWCASLCAHAALFVAPAEPGCALALRLARRYARGLDVPIEPLRVVVLSSLDYGPITESQAACVTGAASYAVNSVALGLNEPAVYEHIVYEHIVFSILLAGRVLVGDYDTPHTGRAVVDAPIDPRLAEIIAHHTAPVAPTLADVLRCRPRAAVVWDAADVAALGLVRLGTLGDALARATRGGWRWACPVERAIAERLDEAHPVLVRARRAA